MIHLAGPVVLAAALAGAGVYGVLARRNAVLVLIGAELMLNAVNVLLVTAGSLPATGLAGLRGSPAPAAGQAVVTDPLLPGPVLAIVGITIAAAEIGLALAVVLLTFRERATSDLLAMRELGEASPSYEDHPDAGELPPGTITGLDPEPGSADGAGGPGGGSGGSGSSGSGGAGTDQGSSARDAGRASGQPTGAVR